MGILGAGAKSSIEEAMSEEKASNSKTTSTGVPLMLSDEEESNKKIAQLKEMAGLQQAFLDDGNQGSGDIDEDLKNWYEGTDKLPSDPLNHFNSNPIIKMDYGLCRNTLTNYGLMTSLRKFLEGSMELLFSDNALMGLAPEDLEERVKVGFTMYEKLYELNRRTVVSLKDYKLKSLGNEDENDKLRMLLSSIPNDKLKALLAELSK